MASVPRGVPVGDEGVVREALVADRIDPVAGRKPSELEESAGTFYH